MTEVKKVEKTAETGGFRNVSAAEAAAVREAAAPFAEKVVAEKALGDMAPGGVAMSGAELADKGGVVTDKVSLADKLGVTKFDPDAPRENTTRDTSFAQAVATRPAAAAASHAPDGPDPAPVTRDPTIKSFAQVRLEREISGEAATISQQAYPDATDRSELRPSAKTEKEMARGAEMVAGRGGPVAAPAAKAEKLDKK